MAGSRLREKQSKRRNVPRVSGGDRDIDLPVATAPATRCSVWYVGIDGHAALGLDLVSDVEFARDDETRFATAYVRFRPTCCIHAVLKDPVAQEQENRSREAEIDAPNERET